MFFVITTNINVKFPIYKFFFIPDSIFIKSLEKLYEIKLYFPSNFEFMYFIFKHNTVYMVFNS